MIFRINNIREDKIPDYRKYAHIKESKLRRSFCREAYEQELSSMCTDIWDEIKDIDDDEHLALILHTARHFEFHDACHENYLELVIKYHDSGSRHVPIED